MAIAAGPASAQVADLEVSLSSSEIIVTPFREQPVRVTVRNRGPDAVSSPQASLGRRIDLSLLAVVPQPDCDISTDTNAEGVLFVWNVGGLSASQIATCDFTFRATATSPTDVVSLRIGATQSGNTDPDTFNTFATLLVARSALDRPTDIAVTARRLPGGILSPGTTQRMELTLSNRGPGIADRVAVFSTAYLVTGSVAAGFTGYDILPRTDTAPCSFFRDLEPPAAQIQLLLATPVPVGTSVACSVDVMALPAAPLASTLEWNAFVRGAGVYDIDQSNNRAVLQIPFQVSLPVPMTPVVTLLLTLLIGVAGWIRLRRA